jgi:cobyric acid synthase CobQ
MFQGTSSHAGKSLMAAAFCRILQQDGFHPAPFKAQNMSLNSYVTLDGLEVARAQALQAKACGLEPDSRMNPILLKPASDSRSQAICLGKPLKTISALEWMAFSPQARQIAQDAYDSLAVEHDVMVLEGAGSPAEINLRDCDYTNMDMARHAEAQVLLVGDIDRGGVIASFVGTMAILSAWEQDRILGYIMNKFRGDASLLTGALDFLREKTGREVMGIVPYLHSLGLPEEDGFDWSQDQPHSAGAESVEIGVVALPHFSNVSDLDPLRLEPDVHVRLIRRPEDLRASLAAVVLPGSKQVKDDLEYLNQSGLSQALLRLAEEGRTEIIGICGGMQMLGRELRDPHGIESNCGCFPGLALLDLTTVLEKEKSLQRVRGRHLASGMALEGYEIHHGQTMASPSSAVILREDSSPVGFGRGAVWGTYLHGLFDADEFRHWFVNRLRQQQGLPGRGNSAVRYDLEPALDRLAEEVRKSLDLEKIYNKMGLQGTGG